MVSSGLERVFEVGHAYRAEKSETSRHLTEFVSLDLEMGFISGIEDVMRTLSRVISEIFAAVSAKFSKRVQLPIVGEIPSIDYLEAKRILASGSARPKGSRETLTPKASA